MPGGQRFFAQQCCETSDRKAACKDTSTAWMSFTGVECGLQIRSGLNSEWFDSTFRAFFGMKVKPIQTWSDKIFGKNLAILEGGRKTS